MENLVAIIFLMFLVLISVTDIRSGMIYNKILLPMAIIGLIFDLSGSLIKIDEALMAALVGGLILFVVQYLSRGGLGGGDIKFAFVLGLWLGVEEILITLFLSTMFAAAFGVIILIKYRNLKAAIPFGPFISLGALISFFFKGQLLELYKIFFM